MDGRMALAEQAKIEAALEEYFSKNDTRGLEVETRLAELPQLGVDFGTVLVICETSLNYPEIATAAYRMLEHLENLDLPAYIGVKAVNSYPLHDAEESVGIKIDTHHVDVSPPMNGLSLLADFIDFGNGYSNTYTPTAAPVIPIDRAKGPSRSLG